RTSVSIRYGRGEGTAHNDRIAGEDIRRSRGEDARITSDRVGHRITSQNAEADDVRPVNLIADRRHFHSLRVAHHLHLHYAGSRGTAGNLNGVDEVIVGWGKLRGIEDITTEGAGPALIEP